MPVEKKRLFIALPLGKETLKTLSKYRDMLGRETPYLRFTPVGNLHVTLLFLGDVSAGAVPVLTERIRRVSFQTNPFSLLVNRAVYAPPNRPVSMVWLTFEESEWFTGLVRTLTFAIGAGTGEERVLSAEAIEDAWKKSDRPHVTLARFKKEMPARDLRQLKRTGLESTALDFDSCFLMESKITSAGPVYKTIERFPFAGN